MTILDDLHALESKMEEAVRVHGQGQGSSLSSSDHPPADPLALALLDIIQFPKDNISSLIYSIATFISFFLFLFVFVCLFVFAFNCFFFFFFFLMRIR